MQKPHRAYLNQPVAGGIDARGFGISYYERAIDGDHEIYFSA